MWKPNSRTQRHNHTDSFMQNKMMAPYSCFWAHIADAFCWILTGSFFRHSLCSFLVLSASFLSSILFCFWWCVSMAMWISLSIFRFHSSYSRFDCNWFRKLHFIWISMDLVWIYIIYLFIYICEGVSTKRLTFPLSFISYQYLFEST